MTATGLSWPCYSIECNKQCNVKNGLQVGRDSDCIYLAIFSLYLANSILLKCIVGRWGVTGLNWLIKGSVQGIR
jgi:hypothetical protein